MAIKKRGLGRGLDALLGGGGNIYGRNADIVLGQPRQRLILEWTGSAFTQIL